MRFRWKLAILLLLIAIVPMMAMRFFGKRGVRAMGDELVSRTTERLNVNTKDRLRFVVESYAQMLSQKRETLEIALDYLAKAVECLLTQKNPQPAPIYWAEDIDAGHNVPQDLKPTASHYRLNSQNDIEPIPVTFSAQVFNLAAGSHLQEVKGDIDRLAELTPAYMSLSQYLKGLVIWQYTALDNGLYSAYPGHGGFPKQYDPRKQPWYTAAMNLESFWADQFVDAVSGQRVIAVSRPINGPDRKITGVTALIIPIRSLLEHRLLLQHIPEQTRAFVAYLATEPGTGRNGIRVIVRESHAGTENRGWETRFQEDWLVADDDTQFQAMLQDLEKGVGNIRRMRYSNCDCLWVYGPIHRQSFLMLITPYAQILKPAMQAEEYIQFQIQQLLKLTSYTIAGIFIIIVILAFAFSRSVTKPLQILAEGARRLAQGQLDTRVDIRSRDEFGDMARVFNSVGPRLEEHYKLLKSLDLAMEVQQNLLPKFDPQIKGLDVAGISDYCEETGGDYYDYLEVKQEEVSVVVGDVSGHGISSALLMTTARAFLRQRAAMPGSIREIVSDVNRRLSEDIRESGQFMTLFYSTIDLKQKIFRWVRAGHDAAFFYDGASDSFTQLDGGGLPLGVSRDVEYEQHQLTIVPGQIIVIGTDGIWETRNPQNEMFGKARLRKIIQDQAHKRACDIIKSVFDALNDFRYPLEKKSDDITLVIIKVETPVP